MIRVFTPEAGRARQLTTDAFPFRPALGLSMEGESDDWHEMVGRAPATGSEGPSVVTADDSA